MNLNISIGKTMDGKNEVFLDLTKDNIHTIAFSGITGSGKSTFHHSVTKQLMKNNTPEEVGFVFMDFKGVEFGEYKGSAYLNCPIVYDPKEAVKVLRELTHESEQRFYDLKDAKKAIIVHIEECDIIYSAPGILENVWKTIDEQSKRNNIYVFFSSSKRSSEVFTPELLKHTSLGGIFISGNDHSEPWMRQFKLRNGKELVCRGYV